LFLFLIIFSVGVLVGALSYRQRLFLPQINEILNKIDESDKCLSVNSEKLLELKTISQFAESKKIFWGDSVVEKMRDSRFYSIDYQDIAKSGLIIYCALQEIEYILNFNPDTVLIYIGGNDADGQSWYDSVEAGKYYEEIIDILLSENIQPIIHLIHEGSLSRNKEYVREYNEILENIAKEKNVLLIPNLPELSSDLYSYGGEHLKPEGYQLWFSHINQYISNFLINQTEVSGNSSQL